MAKYRTYRLERNALRRAAALTALAENQPSIERYYVSNEPLGFGYAVYVKFTNGKTAVCN